MSSQAVIEYMERSDAKRTKGYLVVGAVLLVIGAVLMGLAPAVYPTDGNVTTLEDVRRAYHRDKQREAMFGSGIAVLTSGALMFVGFGIPAAIIGLSASSRRPGA